MKISLLPCPFCNGEATPCQSGASHIIKCAKCLASTRFYPNALDAINAWNSRSDATQKAKCVHAWVLARTYEGYESICVRCLETPSTDLVFPKDGKNED